MENPFLYYVLFSACIFVIAFGGSIQGPLSRKVIRYPLIALLIVGMFYAQSGNGYLVEMRRAILFLIIPTFVVAVHEIGHVIGAWGQGIEVESMLVLPMVGMVKLKPQKATGKRYFWMLFAGPLSSIPLVFAGFIWPQSPVAKSIASLAAFVAFFNLIPIMMLDGGKMFARLCDKRMEVTKAKIVQSLLSVLLVIVAWIFGLELIFVALLGIPPLLYFVSLLKGYKVSGAEESENLGGVHVMKEKLPLIYGMFWIAYASVMYFVFQHLGGLSGLRESLNTFVESSM